MQTTTVIASLSLAGAALALSSCGAAAAGPAVATVAEPSGDTRVSRRRAPKLILQITVDQLRGDLLTRYYDRLGEGGLRYLMDQGLVYANAHHSHANSETIVGHATLATGATPSVHGMVGNVWLDRASGDLTYNVEDYRYPILGSGAGVDKATEIDHTQRTARSDGRSPARIMVSTFSDELALLQGGKSKIFGVSVKDRGAISMAGHAGKAFWFSKKAGGFVTSRFYYDEYPSWVKDWNGQEPLSKYEEASWTLMHDQKTYLFGDSDERPYEAALPGFGRTFPHAYGKREDKYFTTLLTVSPAGDELTREFAETLLEEEDLGKDEATDYLSVSFSSTDYVGHVFGPSSLEAEDNVLRLDQSIAALLKKVDAQIGLENTLIVLSSDHGGPEAPGYLSSLGFEADYIDTNKFDKSGAIAALKKRFGIGEELISTYFHPYLYLNREAIAAKGLSLADVESAVAQELSKFDGVSMAVSSSALSAGKVADTPLMRTILNNHNPRRSGDIYLVFEPNRFIADFDGLVVASVHGSPWRYDSYVPIIFAGMDIAARRVHRLVHTTAIAPTLSLWLGAKLPTGAMDEALVELLD